MKQTNRIHLWPVALALGASILALCVSGCGGLPGIGFTPWGGGTISISPGESVQEAVDRAGNGAVILLPPGTWSEAVVIDKPVTLRGEGASRTELTPASPLTTGPIILVTGDISTMVTIENVKISSPHATATDYVPGIWVEGNTMAVIRGCEIVHNTFGIVVRDTASVTVENCRVVGNLLDGIGNWGAGIVIRDSTIQGNGSHGINLTGTSQSTIQDTVIASNGHNGVHLIHAPHAYVLGCEISGNGWSGILAQERAEVVLENSVLTQNMMYDMTFYGSQCFTTSRNDFRGYIAGCHNVIAVVCPIELGFLLTAEGGVLDRRE